MRKGVKRGRGKCMTLQPRASRLRVGVDLTWLCHVHRPCPSLPHTTPCPCNNCRSCLMCSGTWYAQSTPSRLTYPCDPGSEVYIGCTNGELVRYALQAEPDSTNVSTLCMHHAISCWLVPAASILHSALASESSKREAHRRTRPHPLYVPRADFVR